MGRLYDEGWGAKEAHEVAFHWYRKAALGGLPEAFYFVASAYHFGKGVQQDESKGYEWFGRAASEGDLTGAYMQAICVLSGTGVDQNEQLGMRLLRRAIRRGSPDAMDYLAAHYLNLGRRRLARKWAERAIEAGDLVAHLRLKGL